ncbi:hypothetical protein FF1_001420 [Malus domestica]
MEQSKGRRVILFPLPFQGHINPMLELANILHAKGFSIAIISTNFNSLNPSTLNPHFTYHSIPVDLTENEASMKDPFLLLSILNAKCVEPFREYLSGLLSKDVNSEDPIACLISDPLFNFTRSVAESFKLPRIVLRTGGAASFAVYAAFPQLLCCISTTQGKGLPTNTRFSTRRVTELSPIKVKDLPAAMPNCDPEDFYQLITNMANEPKDSHGLIFNTFEDLEEKHLPQFAKNITPIFQFSHQVHFTSAALQPLLLQLAYYHKTKLWRALPRDRSRSIFGDCLGVGKQWPTFLWVARPGLVQDSDLHEALPNEFLEALNERAHVVKWALQKEVLAQPAVGAFWTH